jgi:hypothetical protein
MKSPLTPLFLSVALALSINVLAKGEVTFIVTDESVIPGVTGTSVVDIDIGTSNPLQGESITQFLNGYSNLNPNSVDQHNLGFGPFSNFVITDKFGYNIYFGPYNMDVLLPNSNSSSQPPSNGNSPNGGGTPGGTPPPATAPEPSTWALLFGSLVGLAIFHRLRFARR